ncbi:MAG TPA: arginine deiminase family protein [Caldilineaceae bacterium]|nr:arginine deiminase family protein [Caldilineaceae bacterium]
MFSAAGFTHAITRKPSPHFADGITTADLGTPDYATVCNQHTAYVVTLQRLGITVVELEPLPSHPDAHFVEDTAVIVPEVAVIARMGAAARQGEETAMAPVLAAYRPLVHIDLPGTFDGGDVLIVEKHCMIGLSERTNENGAWQLGEALARYGYRWDAIPVGAGLHFKSSVNYVGKNTLLIDAAFVDHPAFVGYDKLVIDPDEVYAANTLWINDYLLMPAGFPKTKQKLFTLGLPIIELETSELRKMDGGLTCLSLRF